MQLIPARSEKAEQILDVAQDLVQTRGYNAFSYADIAKALKVTKASVHYHFPAKADLGHALIARYEMQFLRALEAIGASSGTMTDRLHAFVGIYEEVLIAERMCLCGMLAAEFETLPRSMQSALDHYFDTTEAWLQDILERGRQQGEFRFDEPAREIAEYAISTLEGAMILARSHGAHERFRTAARKLTADLTRANSDRRRAPDE